MDDNGSVEDVSLNVSSGAIIAPIPTTSDVRRLAAATARRGATTIMNSKALENSDASSIPPFKVGTLEIYKRFANAYDTLMQRHDCNALEACLLRHMAISPLTLSQNTGDGNGHAGVLRVGDFGCGTGRIALMLLKRALGGQWPELRSLQLLLLDKEMDMLRVAHDRVVSLVSSNTTATLRWFDTEAALVAAAHPVAAEVQLHVDVCMQPMNFETIRTRGVISVSGEASPKLHVIVCAWSLSYVMRAEWGGDAWHASLRATLDRMLEALIEGGQLIIIETLGNGCTEPTRNNTMMAFLESAYGFQRDWVRTDYTFESVDEGAAMCKFFFAKGVDAKFRSAGLTVLPECTGIWTLTKKTLTGKTE